MNDNFSLQQISQTGNLDGILILRQHKLDLMVTFTEIKSINSKLKQSEITKKWVAQVVLYNDIDKT